MTWSRRPAISPGPWPSLSMPLTASLSPGLPGEPRADVLQGEAEFDFQMASPTALHLDLWRHGTQWLRGRAECLRGTRAGTSQRREKVS